jgi:hypothetical protein
MRAGGLGLLVSAAVLLAGCYSTKLDRTELTAKGPTAEELYLAKSYAINGRAPTFGEKRRWESEVEERVYKYLREHPELEQTTRYSEFRFWWQVTPGSTPDEVRVLLEEPGEQTVDPVQMAALAGSQWGEIQGKTIKEAWFYPPAWVLYFDDTSVVAIVHKVSSMAPYQ